MNMKTLLGTAAGLMVATGAYAADLPGDAAPAAVDYVKVCDAYGAGFFYIPGTETCLRVKGRVRASMSYNNFGGDFADGGADTNGDGVVTAADRGASDDTVNFRADANVGFDARTASDLGTVRSYFEIETNDSQDGNRQIRVSQAFIQVGYVTVGRQDEVADGDGLYGINDSTWGPGDYTATGASVLVDNLGGGFFIGAGVYANDSAEPNSTVWRDGEGANLYFSGIAGINGQSWGSFDVSGVYVTANGRDAGLASGADGSIWGVKATANLKVIDKLSLRLWAAYTDSDDSLALTSLTGFAVDNATDLAIAASYQVTDPLAVYAGLRYQMVDKISADADDVLYGNLGVNYTLAPGLNLQGEVDYLTQDDYNNFTAVTRLVREW